MFLSFENLKLRYEPFPIGLAKPVMDQDVYSQLVDAYPSIDVFESYQDMGKPGRKYTLSERENRRTYSDFVQSNPLWRDFHHWIKSDDFIYGVLEMLLEHSIDLGYRRISPSKRLRKRCKHLLRGRMFDGALRLSTRFEFSALPSTGGAVVPHTDTPTKIVTLIVSMLREGEWDPAYGGGTDINRPKSDTLAYNQSNRLADFDDMEVLGTYEYTPNQAVLFIKTFNSWHSVRPMTGTDPSLLRKTLTIVIEAGA